MPTCSQARFVNCHQTSFLHPMEDQAYLCIRPSVLLGRGEDTDQMRGPVLESLARELIQELGLEWHVDFGGSHKCTLGRLLSLWCVGTCHCAVAVAVTVACSVRCAMVGKEFQDIIECD